MKVKEIIFIVEEDPEGGYNAKALYCSIFTEGESLEELKENIKDAIKCHLIRKKIFSPLSACKLNTDREQEILYIMRKDAEKSIPVNKVG